jgi:hypothetical protein
MEAIMRILLYVVASAMSLALTASPAHAFFLKHLKRHHQTPAPACASCEAASGCADGNCGGSHVLPPYKAKKHLLHRLFGHRDQAPYGQVTFNAMPEGIPSAPPPPPFAQPMNYQPIFIPQAPDFYNPGPYGVVPPFAPFQGMLLGPRGMGQGGPGGMGGHGGHGGGMGPGMGGGPGVFGVHPFARSPRDYFMVGD